MSVTTIEEHVDALLQRRVAESKRGGAPQPDLEATAIFDSIALNLLLKPRSLLCFMNLARNSLTQAVRAELATLDEIYLAVEALKNQSFTIEGAPVLERARVALLNIETLPKLSADSTSLSGYENAVSEFLNKYLAKNVRKKGSSELKTPSAEALISLPGYSSLLNTNHSDTLRRLYALAVGLENFEASPFAAILGTTTVNRVRSDLESIIDHVASSGDPAPSRDFAVRLISSSATLRTVAEPPDWRAAIATDAPAYTTNVAPVAVSTVFNDGYGPGTEPQSVQISVSGQTPLNYALFPNTPCLLSDSIDTTAGSLIFPTGNEKLFFSIDGQPAIQVPVSGTWPSATFLAAAITSNGAPNVKATSVGDRILVTTVSLSASTIEVVPKPYDMPETYADVSTVVGLQVGQSATANHIRAEDVATVFNILYPTLITADVVTGVNGDRAVRVTSNFAEPGTELTISAATGYGLAGTYLSQSDQLTLATDDFALIQVGDSIATSSGSETAVVGIISDGVLAVDPIPTFSGTATVSSALVVSYSAFIEELKNFLAGWGDLSFATDLTSLDRALATLLASQAPSQRAAVTAEMDRLKASLTELLNVLTNPSTMLPEGAGLQELQIVDGILATLTERGFARAGDLLLEGDITSMLDMTFEKASYGGTLLRAASNLASGFDTVPTSVSGRPDAVSTKVT